MCVPACAKIAARDKIREGNAAYAQGEYARAIEAYTASVALEPDGVTVFWNRACAAEAWVIGAEDRTPDDLARRSAMADRALADFEAWLSRLPSPTEEDRRLAEEHRLSILATDARCDALIAHWEAKQRAHPDDEAWYARLVRQYASCERPAEAEAWRVRRTVEFPRSVKAWHQRAIHAFEPLWPPEGATVPYNEAVSPVQRIAAADAVIAFEDRATVIDPDFRDAYTWRTMALHQRRWARILVDAPERPEERVEVLRARDDAMLAWAEQAVVCRLDRLPPCDAATPPCCEAPPISWPAYASEHAERFALELTLALAVEPSAP